MSTAPPEPTAPPVSETRIPDPGGVERLRAVLYGSAGRAEALLLLIGLLTWFPTIHAGDVAYDTNWLILENPLLRDGDPRVIPRLFTGLDRGTRLTLGAEYLPFRDLSVLADFALFGANLIGHHLQNLAWYLLSCQLFLQISTGLLGRTLRAFWVAAAFCLHPQHVESVAWLASRKDVLSLAFVNLGLLLALRHGTGWRSTLQGPLCLLIAMWAKNTGIVLPALAFLLVLIREPAARSLGGLLRFVPYALVAAACLALSMHIGRSMGMMAPPRSADALGVFFVELQVIAGYLLDFVWPAHLSALYAEPSPDAPPATLLACGALLGGLLSLALLCLRKRPVVTIGILWFFVALLPVSQIVPIQNLVADRYMLLPSAGLLLAIGALLPSQLIKLPSIVPVGASIGLLSLLALGWRTADRAADWHSSVALWSSAVAEHPEVPRSHAYLGGALLAAGQPEAARQAFRVGLMTHPESIDLLQAWGAFQTAQGDREAAIATLRTVLARDPQRRKSANNLAVLLIQGGSPAEAEAVLLPVLRVHPLYVEGWNTLAAARLEQGQGPAAREALDRALAVSPYDPGATCNLGGAHYLSGDLQAAADTWARCLTLSPGDKGARAGLDHLAGRGFRPSPTDADSL